MAIINLIWSMLKFKLKMFTTFYDPVKNCYRNLKFWEMSFFNFVEAYRLLLTLREQLRYVNVDKMLVWVGWIFGQLC